ncbi:hypothetical protein [Aeromonas caviae]|uniref:hypothetical protein n=1 Tax=Aeromonas caviae TaxID=648 RepID=UPI003C7CD568
MFVIWSHEKGFIMSHQLTFADSEFSSKRRQTRKEIFLSRMEQILPWQNMVEVIEPFYPKAGNGRRPYPLETMLRIHCMQLRIPVNLNSDSGICEHHFRKVCGQGFCEQKLSFEGRHLFDSPNKPAAKRSAAVVDPGHWSMTVHLTSEFVL